MGIIKKAADLAYTFRFLKLLTTPWEKTGAYEMGLIDANGKKLRKPQTSEESDVYTPFHRLVYNIKRLVGGGQFASYASALYLIKEKYGLTDKQLDKILAESNVDVLDILAEDSKWFVLEDQQLSPGIYRVRNEKVLNSTMEDMVNPNDKIRVTENAYPVGSIFGMNVYEAQHMRTKQSVYITIGEITR